MTLNNIIESEDLTSLELYTVEKCDKKTRKILKHILKTGDFSTYRVGVELSIEDVEWYMHIQDGEVIEKMRDEIIKHCIKIKDDDE